MNQVNRFCDVRKWKHLIEHSVEEITPEARMHGFDMPLMLPLFQNKSALLLKVYPCSKREN